MTSPTGRAQVDPRRIDTAVRNMIRSAEIITTIYRDGLSIRADCLAVTVTTVRPKIDPACILTQVSIVVRPAKCVIASNRHRLIVYGDRTRALPAERPLI